jgi:lipopolysaccharide transport system ATP-binding protein
MSQLAIRAEHLAKQFTIGAAQQHRTLRDQLAARLRNPFARTSSSPTELIWALRDVSFAVNHGEVLGVIGYNGAGKSTLLKILTRITEPTRGRAEIFGRVGSLLEVGTGFHPELSGRENIFLNGAILGMARSEIVRKFDEIVAFAEIEKFIDTPVKFYSSGMYVRLAFAVAAHLEPEILIVDEVLAVGDVRFQKKCLAKMQDVGQQGRTVLFVSHSMPAITRLCSRVLMLEGGVVVADGPPADVVARYLSTEHGVGAQKSWDPPVHEAEGRIAALHAVRIRTQDGQTTAAIDIRQPVGVEMEYEVRVDGHVLLPHFHVGNEEGVRVFTALDRDPAWRGRPRPVGRYRSVAWIPGNLLAEGTFFIHPVLMELENKAIQFSAPDAIAFQVIDSHDGDSARGDYTGRVGGVVRPLLEWQTSYLPAEEAAAQALMLARGVA